MSNFAQYIKVFTFRRVDYLHSLQSLPNAALTLGPHQTWSLRKRRSSFQPFLHDTFMTLDASNVERRRQGREAKGDQRGTNNGASETTSGRACASRRPGVGSPSCKGCPVGRCNHFRRFECAKWSTAQESILTMTRRSFDASCCDEA